MLQHLKAVWATVTGRDRPTPPDQSRIESLLGVVPAVVYARTLGPPSVLTYVSGNVQRMLGYSVQEIMTIPDFWRSHLHADDRDRCVGTLHSLVELGSVEMEYRLRAKDGAWHWLHDECRVITDAEGIPTEVVGSCLDVTLRHRSEQALLRSETELRMAQTRLMDALESSDDAFSVFDAHDRLVAFNSHYCTTYPTIADIIRPGVTFAELLLASARRGQYAGVDASNAEDWVRHRLRRHEQPGGVFEQHLSDGRCLEIVERPTAEGGRVAIRRDITARKAIEATIRDEARFKQSLLDALPFPVFYKNLDLVYLGCNGAFCEAWGQSSSDIIGKTLSESHSIEKASEFKSRDLELLARGGIQSYETTFRWGDGSLRQITLVKATFKDQNGKVAGLIGTIIDQTAQRRAEDQMLRNARLATLGQIASEIAHEMNQPLSILRMTSESCLEKLRHGDIPSAILVGKLDQMTKQVGRMGEMIAHLRSFTKADEEERKAFQPLPMIASILAMLRLRHQLDDITLSAILPHHCPDLIGLPHQFEQVVSALLSNARDAVCAARPPGERKITLIATQDGRDLVVSVQDNGGGIPKGLWSRIFTPFFTTKEDGAGTGLGLSVSANVVAAMGGRINGRNEGDGALFQIILPLGGAASQDGPAPAVASPFPALLPVDRPRRILVVDDEPLAVECIRDFLEGKGYAVITAISPLDALDMARADSFDLVLTDQRMPGMDGNVLIEKLRLLHPGLPAIMMSGGAMPMPPGGKGPTAQLAKPLILEDLAQTVARLLNADKDHHDEAAPPPPPPRTAPDLSQPDDPARKLWLIGELTAILAHDFGQPLNIIRLNAENALTSLMDPDAPCTEKVRRALAQAVEQCERMQAFARDLAVATRRPTTPPHRLSAVTVLRDALASIQDRVRMQDLDFSWHATVRTPAVLGHAERLRTALTHALVNACDALATQAVLRHGDPAPWRPSLHVSCHPTPQGAVSMTVDDNGPGIPPQALAAWKNGTGKGLGLPILDGVIAEMGGTLGVETDSNGTRLRITLPAAPRRLYRIGGDDALAARLFDLGWEDETNPAQADAAVVLAEWHTALGALSTLQAVAPDLPVALISDLDEDQARQAVAAGAVLVLETDLSADEIATALSDCVSDAS